MKDLENFDFVKGEAAQAADVRKGYRQDDYDRPGNVYLARRAQFKPMLGLFNQEKLIPLRYCPIQIELKLVNQQKVFRLTFSYLKVILVLLSLMMFRSMN